MAGLLSLFAAFERDALERVRTGWPKRDAKASGWGDCSPRDTRPSRFGSYISPVSANPKSLAG
jgi:hypothetical protein